MRALHNCRRSMKLAGYLVALVVVAATIFAAPAGAARPKVRTLNGQVMAAPYVAKRKVVVPVLLDQRSARRARLRAPAGVLILKGAKKIKVARQRAGVAPALLRSGDRFRARSKVTRAMARA